MNIIKRKILQAKILAETKISYIKKKRNEFYSEIKNIQFKLPQHMSVEKSFLEFIDSFIKELTDIFNLCSKYYKGNGKSKSDIYLNDIMVNVNNLISSLKVVKSKTNNEYNSNVKVVLDMVHLNLENLYKCLISASKASFGVSIGATLDYGPTRKKFQELSEELRSVESAFKQLASQFNIINFIKIFEVIKSEKDIEKFFKSKNTIRGFICVVNKDYSKYEKVKIDYNFKLYDSSEEKFFTLISYLEKFLHYLKSINFKVPAIMLKKLINRFNKIAEDLGTENFECSICYDELSLKDENAVTLPCGHLFCKGCIKEWFKENSTCPICRKVLKKGDLNSILN